MILFVKIKLKALINDHFPVFQKMLYKIRTLIKHIKEFKKIYKMYLSKKKQKLFSEIIKYIPLNRSRKLPTFLLSKSKTFLSVKILQKLKSCISLKSIQRLIERAMTK